MDSRDANREAAAAEVITWDNHMAHRWSAASNFDYKDTGATSLLLFEIFLDLQEKGFDRINLMAGNTPHLSMFISSFNPELVPYYSVEKNGSGLTSQVSVGGFGDLQGRTESAANALLNVPECDRRTFSLAPLPLSPLSHLLDLRFSENPAAIVASTRSRFTATIDLPTFRSKSPGPAFIFITTLVKSVANLSSVKLLYRRRSTKLHCQRH